MFKISIFLLLVMLLNCEEITIDLTNPTYNSGSICTESGGIINTNKMRIQAKNIKYVEENGEKKLTVNGQLLITYREKFFVGDFFSYNFTTKTGIITNGIGNIGEYFFGGSEITFNVDDTVSVTSAFATTSTSQNYNWSINSKNIKLNNKYQLRADNITFNVKKIPVFWFPTYSTTINSRYKKPLATYRIYWEKSQGPLLLMRYRLWDFEGLKVHWRGEYRVTRGGGTAIEIDYESPIKNYKIHSRNFVAYDTFYNDENPYKMKWRYRAQGSFDGSSHNKKIESFARWDALSDKDMRQDFPTQLFELQTLEKTEGFIKGRYDEAFISLYASPRVNTFRGFKQDLPTFKVAVKPYEIKQTGLIFQNHFKIAYLDYVYANNLHENTLNFRSSRIQTQQKLSRPLTIGLLHCIPSIGFNGIFYGNNPKNHNFFQTLFNCDIKSHFILEKYYTNCKHVIEPYLNFNSTSHSSAKKNDLFIFSIQDGFNNIQQLQFGMKNYLYNNNNWSSTCNIYALGFFNTKIFSKIFPKWAIDLQLNYQTLEIGTKFGWNVQKKSLDYINLNVGCTFNEYFALNIEILNRGEFYWRKNNYENYMVDMRHQIDELRSSPLSDKRTIFLARWQLQLSTLHTLQVQNHIGWHYNEPIYHESNVSLLTTVAQCWQLKFNYMRAAKKNEFSFGLTLI